MENCFGQHMGAALTAVIPELSADRLTWETAIWAWLVGITQDTSGHIAFGWGHYAERVKNTSLGTLHPSTEWPTFANKFPALTSGKLQDIIQTTNIQALKF